MNVKKPVARALCLRCRFKIIPCVAAVLALGAYAAIPPAVAEAEDAAFGIRDKMPIPYAEQGIATAQALPAALAGSEGQTLEGALFADNGDLLFCNVSEGKVMRLSPDGKLATVLELREFAPGGLAWHKDGRLFVAGINQAEGSGGVAAVSQDGKKEMIISPGAGYMPNDLVFDRQGGFYFSDFKGTSTDPQGGVYYVSPDFTTITPVIPHLSQANGVALSPDGKTLWATEYARNNLHRVTLDGPAAIPLTGTKIPYHFIGAGPDSMRVDQDGNVYVAMMGQGRVLIFNWTGVPIGQVLVPGREKGLNLRSASLALHPHKPEMRIVTGNFADAPSKEARIFSGPAFAKGL